MQLRHTFDYLEECAGEMTKNSTLQVITRAAAMYAAFPWVRRAVPLLQIHVCLDVFKGITRARPRTCTRFRPANWKNARLPMVC